MPHERALLTVDIAIFTVLDGLLHILLIERGHDPFAGMWALPGGRVDQGEALIDAAQRELAEETGVPVGKAWLEQLGAWGAVGRDPRERVVSVAWYALLEPGIARFAEAGSDAKQARFVPVDALPPLAFDHADILDAALRRMRQQLEQTALAFELVPPTFTIAELRAVYSAVNGIEQDAGNFRRRFNKLIAQGVIEQAPGKRVTATRPAKVWRFAGS